MRAREVETAWLQFRDAARAYCAVIELVNEIDDCETLYRRIALPLVDLYRAGLQLPSVSPSGCDLEPTGMRAEGWRETFDAIDRLTGIDDPYRTVFDPHEDVEWIEAALAEDLADIFVDVFPAIDWDDQEHLNDLLFELRSTFQSNWGHHAVEAMRVLYSRHHRYW